MKYEIFESYIKTITNMIYIFICILYTISEQVIFK